VNPAFHDAEPAGVASSGFARGVLLRALPSSRTPDTSVASGASDARFRKRFRPGSPRSIRPPLREDEASSPTRGAFHRTRDTHTPV